MRHSAAMGLAVALATTTAWAAPTAPPRALIQAPALSAEARQVGAEFAYRDSITRTAFQRQADSRLTAQQQVIEQKTQALKRAEAAVRNATADRASAVRQVAQLREDLATLQEQFIAELARRDRTFAAEIAILRGSVDRLLSTPEGLRALAKINQGDVDGGEAALDDLNRAREEARQVRSRTEAAADQRAAATVLTGKRPVSNLITRFEGVTALDPGLQWDWVTLARLYVTAGALPKAIAAAQRAADTAEDDRARSVALNELADVYVNQNRTAEALKAYDEALAIDRKQAALDPTSAQAQRDVSVSLNKIADVYVNQNRAAEALKAYDEALATRRKLAALDPTSAVAQRDIAVSLWKLASMGAPGHDWAAVVAQFDAMKVRGLLAPADEEFADRARANAAKPGGAHD